MEQSTYLYGKKPSDKGGSALKLWNYAPFTQWRKRWFSKLFLDRKNAQI